jgi:hypothetical protein
LQNFVPLFRDITAAVRAPDRHRSRQQPKKSARQSPLARGDDAA